ncbi:MAG: ribonuclease III [Prevotella sp.]|nr:ribonuclease III [Prevotella sp.]
MFRNFYRNIRLFPKRKKEPYVSFFKLLNFYPANITLYEQALLHKSSSIRMKDGRWINNERLEFLGDAILDAIVADIVFKQFELKKEGFLTNIRARIVQRDSLNRLALDLGLDKLIKTATRSTTQKTYMYGNALEALIGAIYLDQGYRAAKRFVYERLIGEHINIESVAHKEVNFKSRLIEWGQKNRVSISFDLLEAITDKENNQIFQTAVVIFGETFSTGTGFSKKESQQNAAKKVYNRLKKDRKYKARIYQLRDAQQHLPPSQCSELPSEEVE